MSDTPGIPNIPIFGQDVKQGVDNLISGVSVPQIPDNPYEEAAQIGTKENINTNQPKMIPLDNFFNSEIKNDGQYYTRITDLKLNSSSRATWLTFETLLVGGKPISLKLFISNINELKDLSDNVLSDIFMDKVLLITVPITNSVYNEKYGISLGSLNQFQLYSEKEFFDMTGIDVSYDPTENSLLPKYKDDIFKFVNKIQNVILKQTCIDIIKDHSIFFTQTGAKKYHHVGKYGLVEHTIEVLNYIDSVMMVNLKLIEKVDTDIIYFCGILHDIGKVFSYNEKSFNVTNFEKHIGGHIYTSTAIIYKYVSDLEIRDDAKMKIYNCIQCHHGEVQKLAETMCPEAWVVHTADLLSSKLNSFIK